MIVLGDCGAVWVIPQDWLDERTRATLVELLRPRYVRLSDRTLRTKDDFLDAVRDVHVHGTKIR